MIATHLRSNSTGREALANSDNTVDAAPSVLAGSLNVCELMYLYPPSHTRTADRWTPPKARIGSVEQRKRTTLSLVPIRYSYLVPISYSSLRET